MLRGKIQQHSWAQECRGLRSYPGLNTVVRIRLVEVTVSEDSKEVREGAICYLGGITFQCKELKMDHSSTTSKNSLPNPKSL